MTNRPLKLLAFLLMFLFVLPTPQLIVNAQESTPKSSQEKPQAESKEEKELRKREENLNKKEEERKKREEKARAKEDKDYRTLTEFAEDLYASDPDFREQVNEGYINLKSTHASQAYRINTYRARYLFATENEEDPLKLRRLYDNPRVQEYVNRLGQQIVPDDSDKLYSFKVVINPIPYAYTLSTGTILISTGMISLLDNEAQLAYVLAHELAHVYKDHWRIKVMMPLALEEYNKKQEKKRLFWAAVFTAAGAGVGGAVGGDKGVLAGAISGFVAGSIVGNHYAGNIGLDWNSAQENQADDFALKATLGKSFDIQEVPRLYAAMAQSAFKDNRMQLGFLGEPSRIKERAEYSEKLIGGALKQQLNEALKANQIRGMSPEFNLIMADLKRDNGIAAFYFDMFQLARMNLQQSVMTRSDDPLAAYYYGRVLRQVGRTKEELDLANQSLLKAISLDVRLEIPDAQLHRALMLMESKDAGNQAEAIQAFKSYITDYGRSRATSISTDELLPPNLDVIYGYMRLLGEKTWTAPTVNDLVKGTSPRSTGPAPQAPTSIPRIEPASQTLSPTNTNNKKPRKP
ncbi:MAG TPA: M48 family metalloprotease [Candidatus Saccharimonadales bacterium]|nr:M48 family metalloprotease [Candidatus Saccharimonadales bacterium]